MTEMVTSGSMSGEEKRRDGLLGESDNERRRSQQAPPVLYATALVLDSTVMGLGPPPQHENRLPCAGRGPGNVALSWQGATKEPPRWAAICRRNTRNNFPSEEHPIFGA